MFVKMGKMDPPWQLGPSLLYSSVDLTTTGLLPRKLCCTQETKLVCTPIYIFHLLESLITWQVKCILNRGLIVHYISLQIQRITSPRILAAGCKGV